MIKFFKKKKKDKQAKEELKQQQISENQAKNVSTDNNSVDQMEGDAQDKVQHESELAPVEQAVSEKVSREQPHTDQTQIHSTEKASQDTGTLDKTNQPVHEQPTKESPVLPEVQQSEVPHTEVPKETVSKDEVSNALEAPLEKSNKNFGKKMKQLFTFKKKIDEELYEDMETTLLMADVGAAATLDIMENVRKSIKRKNASDPDAVYDALKVQLAELAVKVEQPLHINTEKQPFVILVVGVNGVGKTTTIAKLAKKYKGEGKKVMLAAGDTFRAAAVEQLKTWGQREDIPVMAQNTGADSASVIFDAMTSAKSKGIDVLIADTAGRLHTQANLMQELEKISRVMKKNDASAPHETLIVVDGGTGQNAISQVREFNKAHKLSGIVITKLDGTAKGGVLFNLAAEFGIPVRFIGVGEQSSDLRPYSAKAFVDALVG